jgi:hypothetical protein
MQQRSFPRLAHRSQLGVQPERDFLGGTVLTDASLSHLRLTLDTRLHER